MKGHALHDQVDEIVRRALALPASLPLDEQVYLQAQLARYACLLACAGIEQSLVESLSGYAGVSGDKRLEAFVGVVLRTGANPSPPYIRKTLNQFDPKWADQIDVFFGTNGVSDINSVVSNRNRIAHGESVGIGIVSIRSWAPSARALSTEIRRIVRTVA